ncbi:hypothetical protein [Nonomuraea sp. NPDC003201]
MAHSDRDLAAPYAAVGQPPAEREPGIREAHSQLADRARHLDEIIGLTKHRTGITAVVPADAARSRSRADCRPVRAYLATSRPAPRTPVPGLRGPVAFSGDQGKAGCDMIILS